MRRGQQRISAAAAAAGSDCDASVNSARLSVCVLRPTTDGSSLCLLQSVSEDLQLYRAHTHAVSHTHTHMLKHSHTRIQLQLRERAREVAAIHDFVRTTAFRGALSLSLCVSLSRSLFLACVQNPLAREVEIVVPSVLGTLGPPFVCLCCSN